MNDVAQRLFAALADRYHVERELGAGGMATVYLAHDLRHNRKVAIKVLRPELAAALGPERFLREIETTAHLRHPHILPLYDSGRAGAPAEFLFYVMPFVEGESLRDRLRRETRLPLDDALQIAREVADALSYAHSRGVIHRDIKPENILLEGGHAVVADFGIARAVDEAAGSRLTQTGVAIGTPAYMSPEQATGEPDVDARTDLYALGCVLYEMLAGEPPFTGPTPHAILARRLTEPPRPIRPVRSTVPEAVERALLRALERVSADRFPDVAAFAAALRDTAAPGAPRWGGRRWQVAGAVGGLALLATVALVAMLAPERRNGTGTTRDSLAAALYQRGVRSYAKRTSAGASDAIEAFTAAIRRDSTYADAWAGLAKTYVRAYERQFVFPGVAADSVLQLAVAAVERALALDSRIADAWVAQGRVSKHVDPTDAAPTLRAMRRALALDSSNADAWHFLAISLAESGDLGAALSAWRRSVMADPSYTQGLAFLALGHYWHGQYDSAAVWTDSTIAVDPNYLLGRHTAGLVAVERGDWMRGRAAFEAARRLSTDVELINALAGSALAEARAGNVWEARGIIQRAESLAGAYYPVPAHTAVFIAQAWAALGDGDRALAWLRRYTPAADLHFQLHLRCDPPFAPLEHEPRFRALLVMPRPASPGRC
ncbi:MAG TPA: protein kinase [Gemmatimonadales bacterium]|nr:protein kinase [Gemmatimonadales bacterium]